MPTPEDIKIMEEIQRSAQKAPEPGATKIGEVLEKDDTPMIIGSIQSAGYSYIWDNRTGDRSITNNNMLAQQLKKKRPDGSSVFTTIDPHIRQNVGTVKCLLHSDDPNRQHYDEIGFPVCMKNNLTSLYQRQRHMEHRHPAEFKAIEKERTDKEKAEDREFQRDLLKSVKKGAEQSEKKTEPEAPLYVSDKGKKIK